jgi:FO synthase
MHSVARLVLNPLIRNIQVSWVKLGPEGVLACLDAGANDLGGTLMNESISRAAGTQHGQELPPAAMDALIARARRTAAQRTTLYATPHGGQSAASYDAVDLAPLVLGPVRNKAQRRAIETAIA